MGVLWESSIRAVLIAAAVALVVKCLRLSNASSRHAAACAVLGGMLLLLPCSLWGPKLPLRVLPAAYQEVLLDSHPEIVLQQVETSPRAIGNAQSPAVSRRSNRVLISEALLAIYVFGVVLMLVRLLYGTLRTALLLRNATPEAGFLSSRACVCPLTLGWRRPVVVLPSAWTAWPNGELHAVLAHERAHARRRDPLVQWLAALNRAVFWFHPLAWWLQRRIAALAEEACDSAVIAAGHDPRDYAEYLLHQAHAIQQAGNRVVVQGTAMGEGSLTGRIERFLDAPNPQPLSRKKAVFGTLLVTSVIMIFSACRLERVERAAQGQPTMNERMHRRAEESRKRQEKENAIHQRARTMTQADAQALLSALKQKPDDRDAYWTLVRHYEHQGNVKDLDALRLWYIEHHPGGPVWPGNINPRLDPAGYERGKRLWLAHLKNQGASVEIFRRAADFLDGGDRALAEAALQQGQKAHPNDKGWAASFGRHYAQALLGSREPVTEFNVFRERSPEEANNTYARDVRARLAQANDAGVLAQTAQFLLAWSRGSPGKEDVEAMQLARSYSDRALALAPESELARRMKSQLIMFERVVRVRQLRAMSPGERSAITNADRILLALGQAREARLRNKPDDEAAHAKELLNLASQQNDDLRDEAQFEANMSLGRIALRRGDRKAAARHLLAAAGASPSPQLPFDRFDMNLPRALIDAGDRKTVIEFLERIAPKTQHAPQLQKWAEEIRSGINPELIPTLTYPGCSHDPC
jgi:beta-lactamase regulating signal transducer with metallopeptidase domain